MNKLVLLLTTLLGVSVAVNECGQYTTCRKCLDIPDGKTEGGRANCGWCHFPINYKNGTEGKRCADIRDDPWHCNDLFDTFKCNIGWKCVDQIKGTCAPDQEGEGFGSNATCNQYCQPHPQDKKYRCNVTDYTCQECDPKDTSSACIKDRSEACDNCEAPADKTFRCDRTDKEHPNCKMCNSGDQGCAPQRQACKDCAPPAKLMKCNMTSFQCEQDQSGMIDKACNASCGKITPVNLLGPWRGLMVKEKTKGQFVMGEFDMLFGNSNMTFTWPNKTQQVFDVATSGFAMRLTDAATGDVYQVINNEIAYLKYTQAMGFATKGAGKTAPDSFQGAMRDTESTAFVMWKCNGHKDKCDFSVMNEAVEELRDEPNDLDACNRYPTCHECISASAGNIKCGWCQGGTLNYKEGGQTKFKCGGYKQGEPYKFTCPRAFKTEDCEGYNCDWNKLTCKFAEEGQFPDEQTCNTTCKKDPNGWKKCNTSTKKCENCTQGQPDCNTAAFCEASCNLTYAKCNDTIGKCFECERGKDANCTETKGQCDPGCKKVDHSKAVCNKTSGICQECDPEHSGKGCVPTAACKEGCKKNDTPTDPQYECVWQADPPQCKKSDAGTYTEKECNDACKNKPFAKCDFKNNKCVGCEVGKDPLCMYSFDYCKIMQERGKCKPQTLQGLYRMIMVQKGYPTGEFDIMFDGEGKAAEQFVVTEKNKKNLGHGKMEVTKHSDTGESIIHFTEWTGSEVQPAFTEGYGVYKLKDGSSQTFTVLEFAVSKDSIEHLDDGLKPGNAYYVGVACKDKDHCDFAKAMPPMALTQAHEYYEFLDAQYIQ